jgi:hypothetical protein
MSACEFERVVRHIGASLVVAPRCQVILRGLAQLVQPMPRVWLICTQEEGAGESAGEKAIWTGCVCVEMGERRRRTHEPGASSSLGALGTTRGGQNFFCLPGGTGVACRKNCGVGMKGKGLCGWGRDVGKGRKGNGMAHTHFPHDAMTPTQTHLSPVPLPPSPAPWPPRPALSPPGWAAAACVGSACSSGTRGCRCCTPAA